MIKERLVHRRTPENQVFLGISFVAGHVTIIPKERRTLCTYSDA